MFAAATTTPRMQSSQRSIWRRAKMTPVPQPSSNVATGSASMEQQSQGLFNPLNRTVKGNRVMFDMSSAAHDKFSNLPVHKLVRPESNADASGEAYSVPSTSEKQQQQEGRSLVPPSPVLLSRTEMDELYDLLSALLPALDELGIPHVLFTGSLLGAVRSQSILFNDDDVDVAIIDDRSVDGSDVAGPSERMARELPGLLRKAAEQRNVSEGRTSGGLERKKAVEYTYHKRPWVACDRIKSSAAPRVWIDIFVMRKYDSRQDLKRVLSKKENGSEQTEEYVSNILSDIEGTANRSSSEGPVDNQNPVVYPLYHFDNRKAIELWPLQYFLPWELFPISKTLTFGHIQQVPGPHKPVQALRRFFGNDCFTHYTCIENNRVGRTQLLGEGEVSWEAQKKIPLSDEQYLPMQHSLKEKQILSNHSRQSLETFLASAENTNNGPPGDAKTSEQETKYNSSPCICAMKRSPKSSMCLSLTSSASSSPITDVSSSSSLPEQATQSVSEQTKWFGSALRRYTNGSPDVPNFDQRLRHVMEPHIAKARRRRELTRFQIGPMTSGLDNENSISISNLPIASNIGVPYPILRQERPFLFDEHTYPLHQVLADMLGVADLSQLHRHPVENKRLLLEPLLRRETRRAFHECYDNFVTSFCVPLLHSIAMGKGLFDFPNHKTSRGIKYRYQAFPCIRVIRPGEFSIGPHCDTSYGHSVGNINFHVPLTPAFGTNALYTESHPGREDWHPLTTKARGLGYVFDGARCIHFSLENTTDQTRVSLDFRIAISRYEPHRRGGGKGSAVIRTFSGSEDDDFDDGLCSERMLKDQYSDPEGYYQDVLIDTSHAFGHNSFPGPVVKKKRGGHKLMDPDKRVGFPFTGKDI